MILIKKIIATSILSVSLFAGTLNLATGAYEETPVCQNGIFNSVKGVCETMISCSNGGTVSENGTCISDSIGGISDVYTLNKTTSSCSTNLYDSVDKIPVEEKWLDKIAEYEYVVKVASTEDILPIDNSYNVPANVTCASGYTIGGSTGNGEQCEKTISSSNCPSGQTYNNNLNKCEDYDNGSASSSTKVVRDYASKVNNTTYTAANLNLEITNYKVTSCTNGGNPSNYCNMGAWQGPSYYVYGTVWETLNNTPVIVDAQMINYEGGEDGRGYWCPSGYIMSGNDGGISGSSLCLKKEKIRNNNGNLEISNYKVISCTNGGDPNNYCGLGYWGFIFGGGTSNYNYGTVWEPVSNLPLVTSILYTSYDGGEGGSGYYCPAGYTMSGNSAGIGGGALCLKKNNFTNIFNGNKVVLTDSSYVKYDGGEFGMGYYCPAGYDMSSNTGGITGGSFCLKQETVRGNYSCTTGTLSGSTCAISNLVCPAGYTDGGTCYKDISYTSYNYSCPAGYTASNIGGNANTDSNSSAANPELANPANSSTSPTNNCYISSNITCGNGADITAIDASTDMCMYLPTFNCPSGALNGTTCKISNLECDAGYQLYNGSCRKEVWTCPTGFVNSSENICSKETMVCPENSVEVANGTKPCKEIIEAHCPTGYIQDTVDTTKCKKRIFDTNCKITASCTQDKITCPSESKLQNMYTDANGVDRLCTDSNINNCPTGTKEVCISKKEIFCENGSTYNIKTNKCETEGICLTGYKMKEGKCVKEYTYTEYKCEAEWEGPLDAGLDCLGNCGEYGCQCNGTNSPANNCKKPIQEDTTAIVIIKKRDLETHKAVGSLTPLDYGTYKGYSCGDNCQFYVNKVTGDNADLCFEKENGERSCFIVEGCNFYGEITNNIFPNDIEELNIDDQFTIGSIAINKNPTISKSYTCSSGSFNSTTKKCEKITGNACPTGSEYNSITKVCDRTDITIINRTKNVGYPLSANDSWTGLNYGDSLHGTGGCAGAGSEKISITYNSSGFDLNYGMFSDYNHIMKSATVGLTENFIDRYAYGRDLGRLRIDFNEGIVYRGYCKAGSDKWQATYGLEGIAKKPFQCNSTDVVENGKCVAKTTPGCAISGFTWDQTLGTCIKIDKQERMQIKSTCKMNGHVGGVSYKGAISSIKVDQNNPGRLLFWDSYLDKDIGFIEFVKDVKNEDKAEDFVPENLFIYEMLSKGFTAIDNQNNSTYFSSAEDYDESSCLTLANSTGTTKIVPTTETTGLLKKLSGDRITEKYEEPICVGGTYIASLGRCVKNQKEATCVNGKYNRVSDSTTELLRTNAIWDPSQGSSVSISSPVVINTTGEYEIEMDTIKTFVSGPYGGNIGGNAELHVNGSLMGYINVNTPAVKVKLQLTKGVHSIKMVAYGTTGIALTVRDSADKIISGSADWCKETAYACPDGTVKQGNTCMEAAVAYCKSGKVDYTKASLCKVDARCIVTKFNAGSFMEQESSIKKETRKSAAMALKCSPLTCVNSQCKTASCTDDTSGNILPTPPEQGECISNVCDGFKTYHQICGKDGGCDKTNPLVIEEEGVCKEAYCPEGYIADTLTKTCKKLACPTGTIEQPNGSCLTK